MVDYPFVFSSPVTYNPRSRQFIFLDTRGITTWDKDGVHHTINRALNFPKYQNKLLRNIIYARKYNVYFCLAKDFSLKVSDTGLRKHSSLMILNICVTLWYWIINLPYHLITQLYAYSPCHNCWTIFCCASTRWMIAYGRGLHANLLPRSTR